MSCIVDNLGEEVELLPAQADVKCPIPFRVELSYTCQGVNFVHWFQRNYVSFSVIYRGISFVCQPSVAVGIKRVVGIALKIETTRVGQHALCGGRDITYFFYLVTVVGSGKGSIERPVPAIKPIIRKRKLYTFVPHGSVVYSCRLETCRGIKIGIGKQVRTITLIKVKATAQSSEKREVQSDIEC